jgi:outer membrane protein TolC
MLEKITTMHGKFVLILCVLSGCSVHSVDEEANLLQVGVLPGFSEPATGAALPENWSYSWWETFEDEELNSLIETGLVANSNTLRASSRLQRLPVKRAPVYIQLSI